MDHCQYSSRVFEKVSGVPVIISLPGTPIARRDADSDWLMTLTLSLRRSWASSKNTRLAGMPRARAAVRKAYRKKMYEPLASVFSKTWSVTPLPNRYFATNGESTSVGRSFSFEYCRVWRADGET